MSTTATFKFNLDKSKWGLNFRVPLNLPVTGLKQASRSLLENVFSFTRQKGEEVTGSRYTYDSACEELGRGRSTVATAFKELRDLDLIKKTDRDVEGTEYVYIGDPTSGKFYIIPAYLYSMTIYIDGKERKLTATEVHVLAYLMTECASPINGGKVARTGKVIHVGFAPTSYRKLHRILKYAVSGIRRAIENLSNAGLITRRKEGRSAMRLSKYRVFAGLYVYKKYAKKARNEAEEVKIRTEYYTELREQAEEHAQICENKAESDKEFQTNRAALSKVEIEEVKAEVYEPENAAKLKELFKRRKLLQRERTRILARLGLREDDLVVQCNCEKCKDRGRLSNNEWCTCYPGGAL